MAKMAFYKCFKCEEPYFGGLRDCGDNAEEAGMEFNKEDLICPTCSIGSVGLGEKNCKEHGT